MATVGWTVMQRFQWRVKHELLALVKETVPVTVTSLGRAATTI